MIKKILVIFLVIGIALVLNYFDIRFCPFFNLFNIPCVGCGMTRAVKLIMKGEIIESFKYNFLPLPLLFFIVIYLVLYIVNKKKLKTFINKHKLKFILISILIMFIIWFININNELLY